MPLPIRDGNQSLTTLSTIVVSNAHIPAHTVVSLGTQAITDIATAVSGVELGPNTINALENITVTLGQVTITGGLTDAQLRASAVTIGGSVTATISGTSSVTFSEASVTFGTAVVTGSTSILNFPATQTVTFTQASVTFSQASVTFGTAVITGSTSVLNFPATQTVTFTTAPVTFGTAVVTGSTSILNFPATQTVTFGTAVITGSASILNFPATQTVTFSQASVTFGQATITGSVSVLNIPATQTVTFSQAPVTFGTAVITGSTSILNFPATQTVTFTQASITFGLISGTVTANPTGTQTIAGTVTGNINDPTGIAIATQITDALFGSDALLNALTNLPISGTVTANGGDFASTPLGAFPSKALRIGYADDEEYNAVGLASGGKPLPVILYNTAQDAIGSSIGGSIPLVISGTVTANVLGRDANSTATPQIPIIAYDEGIAAANFGYVVPVQVTNVGGQISEVNPLPISGAVTIGSALPAGTNRIGVVTIGGGTVTIGAGTAQIGSVTVGNSVTIGSLPAIFADPSGFQSVVAPIFDAEVNTIRSVIWIPQENGSDGEMLSQLNPLPIYGTVTANTFAVQGTAVTTSNFTSTTPSTVLAGFNATREVLTIFNEGAGNLHICAGATCTTIAYQVRLSAGDYYEVPNHQTSLTHSAVFATAGTARIVQIS